MFGAEEHQLSEDHVWEVVDSWFRHKSLAAQQIDSYDAFLDSGIESVIENAPPLHVEHPMDGNFTCHYSIRFSHASCASNSDQKPNECRLRNATYVTAMKITVHIVRNDIYHDTMHNRLMSLRTVEYEPTEIDFCYIPLMVNSSRCYLGRMKQTGEALKRHRIRLGECAFDDGGYFLIRGSEKVLISQEINRSYRPIVLPGQKSDEVCRCEVISSDVPKSLYGRVRVSFYKNFRWDRHGDPTPQIVVRLPGIDVDLPLFVTLVAFWHAASYTPEDLISLVCPDSTDTPMMNAMMPSYELFSSLRYNDRNKALEYLASKHVLNQASASGEADPLIPPRRLRAHMSTRVLPHMGTDPRDNLAKAYYLGYMANLCLQVYLGRRTVDDRDHWGLKRLQLSGNLLTDLFRASFENFGRQFRKKLLTDRALLSPAVKQATGSAGGYDTAVGGHSFFFAVRNVTTDSAAQTSAPADSLIPPNLANPKRLIDTLQYFARAYITKSLMTGLATGNWRTARTTDGMKTGVSQNTVRLSFASFLSQIRRCSSGLDEGSKAVGPRLLHTTQFGYLCPAETPEGSKVGLIKNFSLMCQITAGSLVDQEKIIHYIKNGTTDILQGPDATRGKAGPAKSLYVGGRSHDFHTFDGIAANHCHADTKIFVNGKWIGWYNTEKIGKLVEDLRGYRFAGEISCDTSIAFDATSNELRISTDGGRVSRPLFTMRSVHDPETGLVTDLYPNITDADIESSRTEEDLTKRWTFLLNMRRFNSAGVSESARLIEYLDPFEEESSLICMDLFKLREAQQRAREMADRLAAVRASMGAEPGQAKKGLLDHINIEPVNAYTHLELHPSLILSAITSLIPFPDHNQSPRNLYQASMGKQAVGVYALNYGQRFDTSAINVLHYLQRPLVSTRSMEHAKFLNLPAGENVVVAIAVYTGFNQEDSLIMSHAAVDRGLMRCTYYHAFEDVAVNDARSASSLDLCQKFCRPTNLGVMDRKDPNCGQYLQADGLPRVGQSVTNQKIIIGKITPRKMAATLGSVAGAGGILTNQYTDTSVAGKMDEQGYVDSVMLTLDQRDNVGINTGTSRNSSSQFSQQGTGSLSSGTGDLLVKVKIRSCRPPQLGDKFSSRHGQKGTVGMLFRQEDLPFTCDGITPDIIMNPHAIPSRMTIGQLLESLGGKVGALRGSDLDGTPFTTRGLDEVLQKSLHQLHYPRTGYEAMFSGFTGELLNYRIFIGPVFYQRLKHMVLDKISARSTGPMVTITRQPNEGRSRCGGMRIGEMERDCFIGHGASAVLKDRLMYSSDVSEFLVCRNCGLICWHANVAELTTEQQPYCQICRLKDSLNDSFARVTIPYATKLFFQEIMGMGVFPRIRVDVN